MKNLGNYALFQGVWFAAVWGAAAGNVHLGFVAALGMLGAHLTMVGDQGRVRELAFVIGAALVGTAADSVLHAVGLILYPTSEAWPPATSPPWILGLWLGFAMLPRFSLAWLRPRLGVAAALGAIGGPLSFLAGVRLGSIAPGDLGSGATWVALAVEYAILLPLMLRLAPASRVASGAG